MFGGGGGEYEVDEAYAGLRDQAFGLGSSNLFAGASEDEVLAVMMESGLDRGDGCYTLVAVRDGTLSLYLSSGGGIIGTGGWPAVNVETVQFVQFAEPFQNRLQPVDRPPLPPATVREPAPRRPAGPAWSVLPRTACERPRRRPPGPFGPPRAS